MKIRVGTPKRLNNKKRFAKRGNSKEVKFIISRKIIISVPE